MLGRTLGAIAEVACAAELHRTTAHAAMARARMPMQQRASQREQTGFERRPRRGGAAQIHARRRGKGDGFGVGRKPRLSVVQTEEDRRAGSTAELRAVGNQGLPGFVGQRIAVAVDHQHACGGPQLRQRIGVVAQGVGTVEGGVGEGEAGESRRWRQGHRIAIIAEAWPSFVAGTAPAGITC